MLKRVSLPTIFFATYPYIFLLYELLPIRIFGFNIFLVITTIVFFVVFNQVMYGKYRIINLNGKKLFTLLLIFFFMLLCFQLIRDNQPLLNFSIFTKYLNQNRFGITPIIYLLTSLAIIKIAGIDRISKIIVMNAFIQSIIGIVHTFFFPDLLVDYVLCPGEMYCWFEGVGPLRETGILLSSSLYANMILLGIFILGFNLKKNVNILSLLMVVVMLYGLTFSGSRFPGIVAFIFLISIYFESMINYLKENNLIHVLIVIMPIFIFIFLYISPEIESRTNRLLTEGMDVRNIKNTLAIETIFKDFKVLNSVTKTTIFTHIQEIVVASKHLIFGVPAQEYSVAISNSGYQISDNSYLSLILQLGIIYFFLLVSIMTLIILSAIKLSTRVVFFLGYFLLNLFFTNSIYWDIYLIYYFTTLLIIDDNSMRFFKIKSPKLLL